ncbi:MAG TPA: type II toxin-antitoxin system RelE/ParE family toxin [Alphaproteobacteria bacterium]|nr:type II toxin-antitoxin system RelE/ParE family toxin [Alphaproteobacteria bacterium]
MGVFTVTYSPAAFKALRRMPQKTARRVVAKVEALAADPHAPNNNVKALTGRPAYRLRVGDYRVIYTLDDGIRVLAVEDVGPRGSIYE